MALSISRSNVLTKKTRLTDWGDLRKSTPKADDADLKDAIACVVKYRATYGYRRVRARLKIVGARLTTSTFTESCAMKDGLFDDNYRGRLTTTMLAG